MLHDKDGDTPREGLEMFLQVLSGAAANSSGSRPGGQSFSCLGCLLASRTRACGGPRHG